MRSSPSLYLPLLALALAGCTREGDVRSYRVSKVPPAALGPDDDHAGHDHAPGEGHGRPAMAPPPMASAEGGDALAWTLPEGWRVSPEARSMRYATLLAGEGEATLEVAVSRLMGDSGGRLANLNRWRGQLGLPPVGEAELSTHLAPLAQAPLETLVMDATSADGAQRMLVAMLPRSDATWFLKALAPPDAVARHRDAFMALLGSLRLGEGAAPAGHAPVSPAPAAGEVGFTPPEGWQTLPANPPRLATLKVGEAEVTITRFPGAVGDDLGNVNRWRGQVGLPAVSSTGERRGIDVGGHAGALWDIAGETGAILVVSVPVGGQTYFIKMAGPADLLARERARFEAFASSVRLGGGS